MHPKSDLFSQRISDRNAETDVPALLATTGSSFFENQVLEDCSIFSPGCYQDNGVLALFSSKEMRLPSVWLGCEPQGISDNYCNARPGYFEAAQGGTLFLDEIGDISCATQVRLLRLLEERKIQRLGSSKTIELDIRVIAATNKDLAKHVDSGQFRADLFYRLNYMSITVPPLRERREDIPQFVEHFMRHLNRSDGTNKKVISPHALDELVRRPWQGNVREPWPLRKRWRTRSQVHRLSRR